MRVHFPATSHAVLAFIGLMLSVPAFGAPSIALRRAIPGAEPSEKAADSQVLVRVLAARGVHPVNANDLLGPAQSDEDCSDDACLAQLAKAAHADRALFVSISPYRPTVVVTAWLVNAAGLEVVAPIKKEYLKAGRPLNRVIREALDDFFAHFPFDAPDPKKPTVAQTAVETPVTHPPITHPPAAQTPTLTPQATVDVTPAAPNPSPAAQPSGTSGLRIASYVAAGAGVLALAGGAAVALASRTDRANLEQLSDPSGKIQPTADALALSDSLASKSRLTNMLLIGGGAALAAGVALFVVSRPSDRPQVSLVVGPGGGGAFVSGQF